jgi:hypothetical protein
VALSGVVERRLCLRSRFLPPLAFFRHAGFFAPALGFAPRLLLLELRCRLALSLILGCCFFFPLGRLFP